MLSVHSKGKGKTKGTALSWSAFFKAYGPAHLFYEQAGNVEPKTASIFVAVHKYFPRRVELLEQKRTLCGIDAYSGVLYGCLEKTVKGL